MPAPIRCSSAASAFIFALALARTGRRVSLGRYAGVWRVAVAPVDSTNGFKLNSIKVSI